MIHSTGSKEHADLDPAPGSADACPTRARGRRKVHDEEELKAHITNVAFETFQQRSFKGTTMSCVASECAISKRTLYEMFPSKLSLFEELAKRHGSSLIDLSGDFDGLSLEDALLKIFRFDRSDAELQQQAAEVRLLFLESAANPELGELLKQHCGIELLNQLTTWVQQQAECGLLTTLCAEDTAKLLMDVLIGAQIFRRHDSASASAACVRSYMRNTIKSLVCGLAPRSP